MPGVLAEDSLVEIPEDWVGSHSDGVVLEPVTRSCWGLDLMTCRTQIGETVALQLEELFEVHAWRNG